MKKTYIFLTFIFVALQLSAQAPDAFRYQAVVKDDAGVLMSNRKVTFRFEVYKSALQVDGRTKVYSESQQVTTDLNGLVNLSIGKGTVETGIFSTINWSSDSYYIRVSIDKGSGFASIGEKQLLDVPYSQFASATGNIINKSPTTGALWGVTVNNTGQISTYQFPKGYTKMVWNDEFEGTGLPDSTKWDYEVGYVRQASNGEIQYYTKKRIENAYREGGYLHLVSRCDSSIVDGAMRPITSASIITKGKASWLYGYIEVRAKVPYQSGQIATWPAIWMVGAENFYGGWPASGEIDIMEHYGSTADYRNVHFSQHSQDFHAANCKTKVSYCPTASSEFHTFGLQWTPETMIWYLDGVAKFPINNTTHLWSTWPFNKSFYLLLNLALGGWGTNYPLLKTNPQDYQVDYVRIFQ